jgi:catechol 2,3-dioxygenase-like lactoylglutathione lyase family enzyme
MKIGSIVIRCYEFDKMLAFWQAALHYVPREPAEDGWVVLCDPTGRGPNLSLDRVSEKRTGKRSRLHLDLYTPDREAEVERLVRIGATRYPWRYTPDDDFVVLEDPDGNLFCVVLKEDAEAQGTGEGTSRSSPSSARPIPGTRSC